MCVNLVTDWPLLSIMCANFVVDWPLLIIMCVNFVADWPLLIIMCVNFKLLTSKCNFVCDCNHRDVGALWGKQAGALGTCSPKHYERIFSFTFPNTIFMFCNYKLICEQNAYSVYPR